MTMSINVCAAEDSAADTASVAEEVVDAAAEEESSEEQIEDNSEETDAETLSDEELSEDIAKINKKYEGMKAETIVYIPDVLNDEYMEDRFGSSNMQGYQLLSGLNYATTLPEFNDLSKNIITGILGTEELGRGDYVKYIIRKLQESSSYDPVELYIADDRSKELSQFSSLSCVAEYTSDNMEVIDFVEKAYETAKANHEKAVSGEPLDDVPLMVLMINSPKAPDVIHDNEEVYNKYKVLTSDYTESKVAIIFSNLENETLTVLSNPILNGISDSGNVLMFEEIGDINFISIPPLMVARVKKSPSKGDAFYLKGSTIKRIKTAE
ncbi:hypothetical protein SAMN04487770_11351 [Butyrivibrio sp. ob235]|uniref:hypothetical protein n=1 Tax=Butyrivibrio sp. ob235 TaxID=1761780 RepID=UPI0008C8C8BB|nr:hypothetical protein [Butyrivibrio sp. ob235]SEL60155.1 hypothetical protein SAMN04487770_11351 [Butyrivibrio sp. ob235]